MSNFPLKYSTSKKEYHCDGCTGEFPIPKNTMYASTKYKDNNGHTHPIKLCMRCILAMQNKMANGNVSFRIAPGNLRFSFLSSRFRKVWNSHLHRIIAENDVSAYSSLLDEIGIVSAEDQN